jgi:hypothetical protein
MKKILLITILVLSMCFMAHAWDDEPLLASTASSVFLKPNIMFELDNSGSMNTIIDPNGWYKNTTTGQMTYSAARDLGYDPDGDYGGDVGSIYVNRYYYVNVNDSLRDAYTWNDIGLQDDTGHDEVKSLTLNGKRVLFFTEGYGLTDYYGGSVPKIKPPIRVPGKLLKYLFYYASQDKIDLWNHFMVYGQTDTTNFTRDDTTKVRIRVAAAAMEEVLTLIDTQYQNEKTEYGAEVVDPPRIGISYFNINSSGDDDHDDQGGHIQHRCHDVGSLSKYLGAIEESYFYGGTNTPLAETLATAYGYFRFSDKLTSINPTGDYKYHYPYDHTSAASMPANEGEFVISHWCQMNFCVIVTDGEPTQDSYITDHFPEGTLFATDSTGVAAWGPPTAENDASSLLDDLAYYMYNNDLMPDDEVQPLLSEAFFEKHAQNKQWVYTYTLGFNFDDPLLQSTANAGGGDYYTAYSKEQLVDALMKILGAIDEKVNAYAAFAAPKYSFTHGRRGYVATFIPRNQQSLWEGHLDCYLLDDDGNFPTDLDSKTATVNVNGSDVVSWQWDAGEELVKKLPADRTIYTSSAGSFILFNTANISPSDLGINSGDTTQDEADRDAVVSFIRGTNSYEPTIRMGDIFHFNPSVVSTPLKWKTIYDPSYDDFYNNFKDRREVVYTGNNDGMLHCFDVQTGEEIWAFIPASLLTKLKIPALDPDDGDSHEFFVDGKAMVRDIKVGSAGTWEDWKTVLVFGLGMGGMTYCALDVTDPDNPVFLWEFTDSTMGYTEARPVIADFASNGTSAFAGVVLAGGLNPSEVPADQVHADRYEGKSFFVVNAWTGILVKEFKYGSSVTNTQSGNTYTNTNPNFLYAFTSSPLLLDSNNDGLADTLYMLESGDYRTTANHGGCIWKINVGGDPSTWLPTKIYQAETGQTFYLTPTAGYDDQFRIWIFAGTGHRPFPNDEDNLTGQMIALMDSNLNTTVDNDDLLEITTTIETPPAEDESDTFNLTGKYGVYFDFINMAGEIMFEPTPLFIQRTLYFNTYAPDVVGTEIDPCSPPGNQYVYSLHISSTGATMAVSEVEVTPGKILGYGSLSGGKYKIYIGEGELGSSTITDQETVDLSDIFGPIFWKEDRD